VKCPHCDREFSPAEQQEFCQYCGGPLDLPKSSEERTDRQEKSDRVRYEPNRDSEQVESVREPFRERQGYCPWEDQDQLGFALGMGLTLKQSLTAPDRFFGELPLRGGFLNPLLYALIVETTGTLVSLLWVFAIAKPMLEKMALTGNMTILVGIAIPVFLFLSIVTWAILVHGSLLLIGGAKRGFEASFRVVCYSSGPELFNLLPTIGSWIALVWKLYIIVIGLKQAHGITAFRAAIAVALPSLVCGSLAAAMLVVFAAGVTTG
jgi:hypothetical protein